HDYPSPQWRRSYRRRTSSERSFSTIKDPAGNNIGRGWCRLTGLTPLTLWIACLLTVRNQHILTTFQARQDHNARPAPPGLPPPAAPPPPPPRPPHHSAPPPPPPPPPPRHTHAPQPRAAATQPIITTTAAPAPCPRNRHKRQPRARRPRPRAHKHRRTRMSDPN